MKCLRKDMNGNSPSRKYLCDGGTMGRTVTSDARGLQFKSRCRQLLKRHFLSTGMKIGNKCKEFWKFFNGPTYKHVFAFSCSFLTHILQKKTVGFSGIQTQNVRVEGKHADPLPTTMAPQFWKFQLAKHFEFFT